MINLFTGMPGAGKTAAVVGLISKLPGDRPLFVHYDPAAKRRPDQVVLHESLKIPHQPIHADDWPDHLPDDAILIIDEVQDVWRPRASGSKVPNAIAALETHRHSGIDFYLTTQAPRLLDVNVRGLAQRHVHIRDTGWLGRYWYEWPETNDGLNWKTCPVKQKYKLPKKAFELYQSAKSHHQAVRTVPKAFYISLLAFVLLAVMAYLAFKVVNRSDAPALPVDLVVPGVTSPAPSLNVSRSLDRSGRALIDDRVDFIPRVSSKPESAPAYDHLRQIVAMPIVVGGYCVGDTCKCITNQGSDTGLSSSECRSWISNPPFDPYRLPDKLAVNGHAGDVVPVALSSQISSQ
jgi:zona occludens toxin